MHIWTVDNVSCAGVEVTMSNAAAITFLEAEPIATIEHVENRCPRLASLSINPMPASPMHIRLAVDVEFGEHTSGMAAGMVRFSLKRAELFFDLTGCQLPVADRRVIS